MELTIKKMIKSKLKDNGYDGLLLPDTCGCKLDNLMPCNSPSTECIAGYLVPEDSCEFEDYLSEFGDTDFVISAVKYGK